MAITDFFTTTFTIWRFGYVGDKASLSQIGSMVAHIQQARMELVEEMELTFSKAFTVWCPLATDIQDNDTIIDTDGNVYVVKAFWKNKVTVATNKHIELLIEESISEPVSV